jgi:hypothetical protein
VCSCVLSVHHRHVVYMKPNLICCLGRCASMLPEHLNFGHVLSTFVWCCLCDVYDVWYARVCCALWRVLQMDWQYVLNTGGWSRSLLWLCFASLVVMDHD